MKFEYAGTQIDLSQYKYLGYQNGWKSVRFDEDHNQVSGLPGEKRAVTFGYLTEDYPEYGRCRDAKHKCGEKSMNRRGSENVVWCDTCKIYWKYDSSD